MHLRFGQRGQRAAKKNENHYIYVRGRGTICTQRHEQDEIFFRSPFILRKFIFLCFSSEIGIGMKFFFLVKMCHISISSGDETTHVITGWPDTR